MNDKPTPEQIARFEETARQIMATPLVKFWPCGTCLAELEQNRQRVGIGGACFTWCPHNLRLATWCKGQLALELCGTQEEAERMGAALADILARVQASAFGDPEGSARDRPIASLATSTPSATSCRATAPRAAAPSYRPQLAGAAHRPMGRSRTALESVRQHGLPIRRREDPDHVHDRHSRAPRAIVRSLLRHHHDAVLSTRAPIRGA